MFLPGFIGLLLAAGIAAGIVRGALWLAGIALKAAVTAITIAAAIALFAAPLYGLSALVGAFGA